MLYLITSVASHAKRWYRTDDKAASLVEYALLVMLIAILGFVAVQLAGGTLSDTYGNISNELQNANANN